jgi:hypothetical protein
MPIFYCVGSRKRNGGERRSLRWPDAAPDAVAVWPNAFGQFSAVIRRASVRVFQPARLVPHGTGASGQAPRGAELVIEPTRRATRPVTCDRTRPVAVGAYWTPTGRQVQRVRSNARTRPVMATVTSDMHCSCLSYSDRTRPVTLTGAFDQYVFHCVVR